MSDSWKAWELRVARVFGGTRRGPDFRNVAGGGKSDVIAPGWSIEVKLLARPTWGALLAATRQAEGAAGPNELPVAIVKKKFADDHDALVVLRLETFQDWFCSSSTR